MTSRQKVPEIQPKEAPTGGTAAKRRHSLRALLLVALVLAAGLALQALLRGRGGRRSVNEAETFLVRRGPLTVTVSESGSLQAERVEAIRSWVKQPVAIKRLVPEGTQITAKDVEEGKVLVELESSDLEQRYTKQEIAVENAAAAYTKAKEDL